MAKIGTKELFDKFFEEKDATYTKKVRPQVDRPEVYEYERKIGKQLVDMTVDELFEMLKSFSNNRATSNSSYSISYASYDQMASMYRAIFNFYIYNYEVIINPWNDKAMRGMAATQRLAEGKTAFTTDTMNEIIDKVRKQYDIQRADYIECIMLLFYNGFAKAEEIVTLRNEAVDPRSHTVRLMGRTLKLSDRCWELLESVNHMTVMPGYRGDFDMVSWHDGYFKFSLRPKEVANFPDETMQEVAARINRVLATMVKKNLGMEISYRTLYMLGFYDSMVDRFGKERTKEIITSVRVSEDVKELEGAARKYGMDSVSISHLKKNLRPFVD